MIGMPDMDFGFLANDLKIKVTSSGTLFLSLPPMLMILAFSCLLGPSCKTLSHVGVAVHDCSGESNNASNFAKSSCVFSP